jgi:arsenite methyltransferase
MDDPLQVAAFHSEGASALLPIYHFNALATSAMVPKGGAVLDLGSGSGQYLAYLARARPDLQIVGIELAETMLALGQDFLDESGLTERVKLVPGDMTDFTRYISVPVSLVSSVFSLHHLPTLQDLELCLGELKRVRERFGCAIWIFDHARPHHPDTPRIFPEVFTPDAPAAFKEDSRNSLTASYSFDEIRLLLEQVGLGASGQRLSRWLRLYQVHWLEAGYARRPAGAWQGVRLPVRARREYAGLRLLFPGVPQDSAR